jgi:hypothetical protein
MLARRLASTAVSSLVALGVVVAVGSTTPASAANSVTCNGGYTSAGPQGTFTYTFSADVRAFTGPGINHDVTLVMTYTGVNGVREQRTHSQVNGFIRFTDTITGPGFVQGVDIADQTYIDGQAEGAFYVHPSCRTYAQELAPAPTTPAPAPPATPSAPAVKKSVPGKVTGLKAKRKGRTVTLTWKAPSSVGTPITGYKVAGSKQTTTRTRKAVFKKLKRGTYKFKVSASNRYGKGPASKTVRVTVR